MSMAVTFAQTVTDPSTTLGIPIGVIVSDLAEYLILALVSIVMWALRFLPSQIYALLMTMRVDQLLTKAVAYGLNAVAGADGGRIANVNIGNRVLKEGLSYALTHGPNLLKQWAGDPILVAEKLWARLDLPPEAAKPDFRAVIAEVKLSLPGK